MPTIRGRFETRGVKFAIVVARFNEFITRRLLQSAVETLEAAGVSEKNIDIVWVPGALEVPYFCKKVMLRRKYHGVIALACVLRGGTYHFECVSNELTRGVSQAALECDIPVATGIITADTLEQAIDRAGLKSGNKGAQAALTALEIAGLSYQFDRGQRSENGSRKTEYSSRKKSKKSGK